MLREDIVEFLDGLDIDSYEDQELADIVADQFNISKDKAMTYTQDYLTSGEQNYQQESLTESSTLNESAGQFTINKDDIKVGTYNDRDLHPYFTSQWSGPWSQDVVDWAWKVLNVTGGSITLPDNREVEYAIRRCFGGMNGEPAPARARITWPDGENVGPGNDALWVALLAVGYFYTQRRDTFDSIGLKCPSNNRNLKLYINDNKSFSSWGSPGRTAWGSPGRTERNAAIGVALWDSAILNQIVDKIPQIKQEFETRQQNKKTRAPRGSASASAQAQSAPITPGRLRIGGVVPRQAVDSFLGRPIEIINAAGYDVLVTDYSGSTSGSSGNRPYKKLRGLNNYQQIFDVIFGVAPNNLQIDGLVVQPFENGITGYTNLYSSEYFRNLPERNFANWIIRYLRNKEEEQKARNAAAQQAAEQAMAQGDYDEDEEVEESYKEPSAFDIDENEFLEREGFEGYYESLNESDEYTKEDCERDLRKMTQDFSKEQGTITAWDKPTRDFAREILRKHYDSVEVSDGRMSSDEEPSWVFAFSKKK